MGKAKVDRTTSAKDTAAAMGISRAALSKWVNDRKAPCRWTAGGRYYFDLVELTSWRDRNGLGQHGGYRTRAGTASTSQAGSGGTIKEQLELADLRRKLAAAEKQELELAVLRGEVVKRSEVDAERDDRVAYARSVLLGGPTSLAPDIAMKPVDVVEEALRDWVHRALKELAGG